MCKVIQISDFQLVFSGTHWFQKKRPFVPKKFNYFAQQIVKRVR